MDYEFHEPVLVQEVIEGLGVRAGKKYIDATVGGGGHTFEILKRGGEVLGIDVDEDAIRYVESRIQSAEFRIGEDVVLIRGNFSDIGAIAKANGFEHVAGIVFDLGVSLHQFSAGERGFSLKHDGPLDMRMSGTTGPGQVRAADLVNGLYKHELIELFQRYGEEKLAVRISDAICRAREVKRIETTGELAKLVEGVKGRHGRIHPATQVFQALRIAVNDELGSLQAALPQATNLLEKDGRLMVISFHSLEDRIVKQFFGKNTLTKKPIVPSEEEIARNPRARSAKLRIYAKNTIF